MLWRTREAVGYESVLDAMEDGVMTVDGELCVVGFNRAAERLTGYRKEEALGRRCFEVCAGRFCQRACDMQEMFETGRAPDDFETFLFRKDGSIRIVRVHTVPVRDRKGRIVAAVRILRDVTALRALEREAGARKEFGFLCGRSEGMARLYEAIEGIRDSTEPVLIVGEPGTEKVWVAETIHRMSLKAGGVFIPLSTLGISEVILERELFGFVEGAFPGAASGRPGALELCRGGSVFLEDVAEVSPQLQERLRAFLEGEGFTRVGGREVLASNARLLAGTSRDLAALAQEGRFDPALADRLLRVTLAVPPLRERREDIPLLVERLTNRLRAEVNPSVTGISQEALSLLLGYDYPGNVRELESILSYAFALCREGEILPTHLPPHVCARAPHGGGRSNPGPPASERERILAMLEATHWRVGRCAKLLGMDRTTLWRKMKKLGIQKPA